MDDTGERYVIGQVKATFDGEETVLDVYDDGTVILPNGERTSIDESVVTTLRAEYNNAKNAANNGAKGLNINVGRRESHAYDTLVKTDSTLKSTDKTLKKTEKALADINHNTKRNGKLALMIAIFAIIVLALIVFMNFSQLVQLSGQITGEYKVAVANVDIASGETISDSQLSYITVSTEEYNSLCGNHFVDANGKMVQDTPIFFIDRGGDIVNKFAAENISAGDIIMTSSVSAQKASQDMYVVETEDQNGNRQTQNIPGSVLSGDTTIEYFARIKTSSGEAYEVPLSSIKLRDKTIEDVLNEQGASILTQDGESQATSDSSQTSQETNSEVEANG